MLKTVEVVEESFRVEENFRKVKVSQVRNLEGRLLTFIEGLGLSELQDNGAKGTIKLLLWDWYESGTGFSNNHPSIN